jgi:hypothetical protein
MCVVKPQSSLESGQLSKLGKNELVENGMPVFNV